MSDKLKTVKQIKAKKVSMEKEFAKLPHYSMFGTDNHAIRDVKCRGFNFLLNEKPDRLDVDCKIDELYDEKTDAGEDENPESEFDNEIHVLEWALGRMSDV